MVRSIFRVVEYIMGHDSYLLANEWPLYIFDAVLMFFVIVLFKLEVTWLPSKRQYKNHTGCRVFS